MSMSTERREEIIKEVIELFSVPGLENSQFLRELKKRIPEIGYYSTLCDETPDLSGNVEDPKFSLVLAVFDRTEVQLWSEKKVGEINKLFLRLIYLRSLIQGERTYFGYLSKSYFDLFCKQMLPLFKDSKKLFFLILSLIFDDLGRTEKIRNTVDEHKFSTDHDSCWRIFLNQYEASLNDVFPSFKLLSEDEQRLYKKQVMTNSFNLGAFVQGESVPYSLYELIKRCDDYYIRIIVLVLAFTSFNYDKQFVSTVFTNEMCHKYLTAILIILNNSESIKANFNDKGKLKEIVIDIYDHYLRARASMSHVPTDLSAFPDDEICPLLRIIALARAENDLHWRKIVFVWKRLADSQKTKLIRYMSVSGFQNEKAIYVYYAPAMIANTIKKYQVNYPLEEVEETDFDRDAWTLGLQDGISKLIDIYDTVANEYKLEGNGVLLYNAATEAMQVLLTFHDDDDDDRMEVE
mmetsp:Transcript_6232/g.6826  ORF Transcript_6232/g.6826 Transcript_6232/m.6826 type:complete len:463 (-) Transcript_6232:164-1552(-)